MPGQTQPQRPAGWYRSMEPAWATEHYGFPVDPNHGDTHTATDNSEWTFDLLSFGEWDLSRYSPDEVETGIRLFEDAARKAPPRGQTPREQLAEIVKNETGMAYTSKVAADRIISAGFRPPAQRITTLEELDAIPVRTVIVDDWETIWRRGDLAVSWFACERHPDAPARVVLPATVLHTPRNGDNR